MTEERDHEWYKARQRKYYAEMKESWDNFIKDVGCFFCGSQDNLVFHHREPSKKSAKVSDFLRMGTRERLMEEVDKCEVVCQSCHERIHNPSWDDVQKFMGVHKK